MKIYLKKRVGDVDVKVGDVDVNLLLHLTRGNNWEYPERLLREKLESKFERIRFGNSFDRQTVERGYDNMTYNHYLAYHGRIENANLQEIIGYIEGLRVPICYQIPKKLGFELPFENI